jgi:hemolysin activation/secretion protein
MALWGRSAGAALLAASALSSPLSAQVASAPTREEIQRAPAQSDTRIPARLKVEGDIERAPCPLAEPRFASVSVQLSEVVFENLRGLSAADLRPAYSAYLGKAVPIATICEIRDAAATILRRAGYLAAVQVPPQKIENGVVRFDVLMAKLVSIQVRGDAGRSEKLIASYLQPLTSDAVFNEHVAERYLLLARDLPGFDVRLRLHPAGSAPGDVIGEVVVMRQPYALTANVQNLGSNGVGRWGALVQGELYDLLGGDRATIGVFNTLQTDEQTVLQLGYDKRIGGDGLTLGGSFVQAWTKPDLGPSPDTIRSRTMLGTIELAYPLVRTQAVNLRLIGGLDLVNQRLRFNGIGISRDRLRVAFAWLDYSAVDQDSIVSARGYSGSEPRWRVGGSLELRQGVDLFDASKAGATNPQLSRIEADPTAFLARYSGSAEFRPSPAVTLAFNPRAQYSSSALASYEEFSAGNYTVGRGYDPGTIIGDKGVGFQSEIRIGKLTPQSRDALAFQPYGFFDQAWVWNNDSPDIRLQQRQSLSSAGGGVRMAWGDHARLDVSVAAPLKSAGFAARKGDPRLLMSLSTRLLPW